LWRERVTRDHVAVQLHVPAQELDDILLHLRSNASGNGDSDAGIRLV
jgi:hypothetical protein